MIKCPQCGRQYKSEISLLRHKPSCGKLTSVCKCGKREDEFSCRSSFVHHLKYCKKDAQSNQSKPVCRVCGYQSKSISDSITHSWVHRKDKRNGLTCAICKKAFSSQAALRAHNWIHIKPEPGKEWGDKDEVRRAMQILAATHLNRIPLDRRVAICLPGDRPKHELELLSNPGFSMVHMVEYDYKKAQTVEEQGYKIKNADFFDVLRDLVNTGVKLALIDYDICGHISYADGSMLLDAIRQGGIADTAVIRVTSCRRAYRRDGAYDVEALSKDLIYAIPNGYSMISQAWTTYVGRDRSSMMLQQWVVRKE